MTVMTPNDPPKRLMRRLFEAVEQHGYRQSELARHVDVHYSTISRWLREYENTREKPDPHAHAN